MSKHVKKIPDGFHTLTPALVVRGCTDAILFYTRAFGAKERYRMPGPDGKIMHAELQVGDTILMLADEMPEMGAVSPQTLGGAGASLFMYTNDTDGAYNRALDAGAVSVMEPQDMFWGDRFAKVRDPYGHEWQLATHIEDVSPEEMRKRSAKAFGG